MQIKQLRAHVKKTTSKRVSIVLIALVVAMYSIVAPRVTAFFTGGGCIANISPTTANLASSVDFVVTVTNAGASALQWVDIAVPSTNYIYAANAIESPWSATDRDGGTTAEGGSINSQQSNDFRVTVITALQSAPPQDWVIQASTSLSGTNPITCTGSVSTSMSGSLPQDSVNGVDDVMVSAISQQSATITWTSSFPTSSLVYYGTTSNYATSSNYDQNNTLQHTVVLTGLSPATTYHFQVAGTDGAGSYAYSLDNTFVTASAPVVPPPSNPTSNNGAPTTTTVPQTSPNQDVTPPQIILPGDVGGIYKQAPELSGTAIDNQAVRSVEYSIDDGINWLPVDSLVGVGKKEALFSFTPTLYGDGNYELLLRATDTTGNTVTAARQTVVIDTLPPAVGGGLTTLGPLIVKPDESGVMHAPVGVNQRFTVNAVGGPISVVIDATDSNEPDKRQSFSLTRSLDTGLWSGALNFRTAGSYKLVVRALDGADNKTERALNTLVVDQPALVTDTKTGQPLQANISVYYRDPDTKTWVLWDGLAYGQSNPVTTTATGMYNLYLPGGIYYLKVSAPGYSARITKSFTISDPTTVAVNIALRTKPSIRIGSLRINMPGISLDQTPVAIESGMSNTNLVSNENTPTSVPDFSLTQTDGTKLSLTKLFGKPTVISFVTTWSQPAQDQLAILDKLDRTSMNIVAVDAGESQARLIAYQKIAGYTLPIVIDNTNGLTGNFGVASLPTTYFVDRHGVIKTIKVGVLSKEDILRYVSNGL